jgi:hypothetical protein
MESAQVQIIKNMESAQVQVVMNKIQPKIEFINYDEFVENICPDVGYLGMAVIFFCDEDISN